MINMVFLATIFFLRGAEEYFNKPQPAEGRERYADWIA
jgi:hypothetical protein